MGVNQEDVAVEANQMRALLSEQTLAHMFTVEMAMLMNKYFRFSE